jgi:hypothetical protein
VKKKCKLSLWFFIFSKTVYLLTVTSLRCTILHIANKPKGCFVSGRFVSTDVLSRRTFCFYGCFVPTDVLSLWTFCPYGRFVPRMLCLRLFCLRTFCLRTFCLQMFCPYGRFVSGRFVWAPSLGLVVATVKLVSHRTQDGSKLKRGDILCGSILPFFFFILIFSLAAMYCCMTRRSF